MVFSIKPPKAPPAQVKVINGKYELILRQLNGDPLDVSDAHHPQLVRECEAFLRGQIAAFKSSRPTTSTPEPLGRDPHANGKETVRDGGRTRVAIDWNLSNGGLAPPDPSP